MIDEISLVNESRIKGGVYSEYEVKWLALINNIMKTIQLIVILLVIAFIIVVLLVGSGMLFGKATAQVDLQKEMLIAEFHVLSNIPNLFETMA